MNAKRLEIVILCLICTAIGGGSVWYALEQGHEGEDATHAGDDVAVDAHESLPPETLANLGVTTAPAEATEFVQYRSVPAVIERTPFNEQPVHAPAGGRVAEVLVEPGTVIRAGQTLVTLVRDPIPRPTLSLTKEIIKPAREDIHKTVVEMRKARKEIDIVDTELERIKEFTGKVGDDDFPIIPRQTAIDLRYKRLRAQRDWEQARLELQEHGYTEKQIDAIAAGGPIPNLGQDTWKRALERNGLWSAVAQELFDIVAPKQRSERWTIATIGELTAAGLAQPALVAWLEQVPDDCEHFLEIGALLQRGYSVEDIRLLHEQNALDPIVEVRAPGAGKIEDWDCIRIDVKPGARVTAGSRLVTLLDPRELYLRTEPVGGEKAEVLRALADGTPCRARPLVAGSGPDIAEVKLGFVSSVSEGQGTVVYSKVSNEPLVVAGAGEERSSRSWKLRAGLRYLIQVPMRSWENVYVFPSDAVTSDGPHQVVFVREHDEFRSVRVEILYRDDSKVVIAIDEHLHIHPGDEVVMTGAFALGLALEGGSAAEADAHAGHQH